MDSLSRTTAKPLNSKRGRDRLISCEALHNYIFSKLRNLASKEEILAIIVLKLMRIGEAKEMLQDPHIAIERLRLFQKKLISI